MEKSVPFGDLTKRQLWIAAAATAMLVAYIGNGDGTFARTDVAVGDSPRSVAIGDLNNDGDQDVVVANFNDDDISVLLGNGDGTFTRTDVAVGMGPQSVAIGNINFSP